MAILITYEINKGVDVVYTVATSQAEADAAVAELAKNGMTSKLERLAQASLFFWSARHGPWRAENPLYHTPSTFVNRQSAQTFIYLDPIICAF